MPKICYRKKKFSEDRVDKIEKANVIIAEYAAQGFELTLRQLYYQFVSRGFIPNNQREYKNLGDVINDARLAGLPVKRTTAAVYALSGLFAAIAGLVLAGRLASAQPQAAAGYELDAIAAVVIGGASLSGGVGKASGTLIGALVLAVIRNGLNLLNVTAFWQQVVIGLVIALAVGIDVLRHRRS
jgi:ABC-type xylose transport system permease subunit